MKTLRISLLIYAAILVASSYAQSGPKIKVQAGHHQWGQSHDLTKRALHTAVDEINKGLSALRQGLPIYNGNRVDAIEFGSLAKSEILVGLLEQRLDNRAKSQQREMDNDSARKYSERQIHNSNEKLVMAGHHFENALGILNRTNWDYDGHKTAAVRDLRRALDEIRAALAPYGGSGKFMPKGGFRD